MKKFFLAIFLGFFPLSTFAFSDVQNSEFKPFIENMVNEKLISGYSDGKCRPNNSVSFFEALKISNNTANGKTEIPANQNEGDFFRNIYENKFSQTEKIFTNNNKISRDFAMYIILKNIGVNLENTKIENNFIDVNKNSIFANYINFAKNNGIIGGYTDGTFGPNNNVSRGEFAKMTWKTIRENRETILQNYQKILDENKNFSENNFTKNSATVIAVSDGDTIKVRNAEGEIETLRILGFDAPESFDTRFGYIECYGKEASDFLKKYLPVGTNVEIIYHGNDKYKRDLAEVFVNGESIAKTMLKNGYGWVYRGEIEPSNYRELLEIENSLKNSNIGLWASHTCGGERKKATETSISTLPTNTNTTFNTTTNTTNNNSQNFPQKTSYKSQNGKDCGDMIKGNINSSGEKIYHSKGQRDYEKTEAEYCFATSFEAEQAGYRAAKR